MPTSEGTAMPTTIRIQRKLPRPLPPAYPPMPVRRFTVDEYHQLIQTGILKSGDPFELIHGWIVPKMPTNPTHSCVVSNLDKRLQRLLGDLAVVRVQQPITTPDSEPEPDLTVCQGPEIQYFMAHPLPEDVHFVIEVSDSTLQYDRGEKFSLYAESKIRSYWIVNIEEGRVEVYSKPRGGKKSTYRRCDFFKKKEAVPVVIDGKTVGTIPVNELLL